MCIDVTTHCTVVVLDKPLILFPEISSHKTDSTRVSNALSVSLSGCDNISSIIINQVKHFSIVINQSLFLSELLMIKCLCLLYCTAIIPEQDLEIYYLL